MAAHENVSQSDIAMNEAFLVRSFHFICNLNSKVEHLRNRQ